MNDSEHQSLRQRILDCLNKQSLPKTKTSPAYNIGLFIVAVTMVLLPLVYLGLIGSLCWALYMYTTQWGPSAEASGREMFWGYVLPLVVGTILVFFMIKPLFARRAGKSGKVKIKKSDEPFMFEYISALCSHIGAPEPCEIIVDCEVNASASFRNGLWSLFRKNDLVLTIGLPLVTGMPLRNLTGVLSHEFGHFSQGFAMRLTLIIRSVNYWFARVVYERDAWDERLRAIAGNIDLRLAVILYLAMFFIFITRKILWILMIIGEIFSSFMLRQMEFDADSYEAKVAGGEVFGETAEKLLILNLASHKTFSELQTAWEEKRLADNLPLMISENVCEIPVDIIEQVLLEHNKSTTGFFDSHPCDSERVIHAEKVEKKGIFNIDSSTEVLFDNLHDLAVETSLSMYKDILGKQVNKKHLRPLDEINAHKKQLEEVFNCLSRVCQDSLHPIIPITGESLALIEEIDDFSLETFQNERRTLIEKSPQVRRLIEANKDELKPSGEYKKAIERHRKFYSRRLMRLLAYVEQLNDESEETLVLQSEMRKFSKAVKRLADKLYIYEDLRRQIIALQKYFAILEKNEDDESARTQALNLVKKLHGGLVKLKNSLSKLPYPYDYNGKKITIRQFLLPSVPRHSEDPSAVYSVSCDFLDKFMSLYHRLLADLARIAEEAEARLGLEKLQEVDSNKESENSEQKQLAGSC